MYRVLAVPLASATTVVRRAIVHAITTAGTEIEVGGAGCRTLIAICLVGNLLMIEPEIGAETEAETEIGIGVGVATGTEGGVTAADRGAAVAVEGGVGVGVDVARMLHVS